MPFTIEGNEIDFRGTARFTGGTGAYRGISSGTLEAHDHNTLDGQNGVVSLKGFATLLERRQRRRERAARRARPRQPLVQPAALALGRLRCGRARCACPRG